MKIHYPNGAVVTLPPGALLPPGYEKIELGRQDFDTLAANIRIDPVATERWMVQQRDGFPEPKCRYQEVKCDPSL